jgi:serine/threonine protein kinase
MNIPNVIGEGAYGCIHKPSLVCKGTPISSYKNKVSKILKKEDADQELNEYEHIREVDKSQEYYLGYPEECNVANIPTNIRAIEKCTNGKELLDKLDELSLLVMNDGGINLQEYANKMEDAPATLTNKTKMERFFIEFHRIICAINMYLDHDIIHCDMKPQNIVFSESTGKMNIIDFGLTTTQKDLLTQSQKSTNQLARYHWSYPFEMFFLNKNVYMYFAKLSKEQRERYYQSILYSISGHRLRDTPGGTSLTVHKEKTTPPEYVEAIQGFYSYIFDHTTDSEEFKQHMSGFYQTIVIEMTIPKYNAFVNNTINTIDVYGTGISLLYVLKKTKHLLTRKLYEDLNELGNSIISAQLSKRIAADELLDRYESILTDNDIMRKYAKYFKDHKVVHGEPIPKYMNRSLNSIHMGDILLNQQDLDKIAVSLSLDDKPSTAKPKKSPKVGRKRTKKQPIQKGGRKNPRCTYKRRH